MSLFRRLLLLVTDAILLAINREVETVSAELATAEHELAVVIARRLGVPLSKVAVKICVYPDGSKLPSLELKFGVSCNQLILAQEALDSLVPTRRPNVRTPHPAVN